MDLATSTDQYFEHVVQKITVTTLSDQPVELKNKQHNRTTSSKQTTQHLHTKQIKPSR